MNRKPNQLITLCKVTIIMTLNGPIFIDTTDIPLIKKYHWNIDKYSGYAVTQTGGKKKYMHRLIAQTPERLETDHIDGCKVNNRRSNLRAVNNSLNQLNRKKANNNSSSQELGVTWRERHRKWEASLTFQNKHYYLGLYRTKEEAVTARSKKLHELLAIYSPEFLHKPALDTVQIISTEEVSNLPDEPLLSTLPPMIYNPLNVQTLNLEA